MYMIHWLLESAQNLTEPPEAFLSAAELEKFSTFRFEKRRNDWLLGRWTAKRLLQAVLLQQTDELIARDEIEIFNDADGVPHVTNLRVSHAMLGIADLEGLNVTISHSNDHALCAVSDHHIGADLEFVEPRAEYLVRDYFTANEIARVNASSPAQHDMVVTAIWSAKEAVLKAMHKGLSVDTRAVEISIAPFENIPAQWMAFEIKSDFQNTVLLHGWWRAQDGFVLTLAATAAEMPPVQPLLLEMELIAHSKNQHNDAHHRIAQQTHHHARHDK